MAIVVGSGISGARLSDSTGLALLINAAATGTGLIALILAFGPASGAHMNPVVSLAEAWLGAMRWSQAGAFVVAQISGSVIGAVIANAMYGEDAITISNRTRGGSGILLAEAIATFGLLVVILGCARSKRPPTTVAFAVGAYISSAYFFTSSTSFANPAVTVGRMFTDTFTGIGPVSASSFVPMQLLGGAMAVLLLRWLYPTLPAAAHRVVIPPQAPGEEATP
ncbi:MAG: aquaporin [Actinomycetota bacterium]